MYKVRFYCIDGAHYEYLEQETIDPNVTCSTHPESDIKDFVVLEEPRSVHRINEATALRTDKFTVDADGRAHINTLLEEALVIGNGAVGVDYKIVFHGDNDDGQIIWQESKDKFKFDCGLDITGCGFVDVIDEYTLDAGVTIEGVLIKDGEIDTDLLAKKHEHSNKAELDLVTDGDHDVRTDNPHEVTVSQVLLMTYVEDETVSSTTDKVNWQQKLRMNFTPPSIGDYLLEWSVEISNSKVDKSTYAQIELDDTTQINSIVSDPDIAGEYTNHSGFKKLNFADTNLHTIDVDFKAEAETASIRRVRLDIIKL